MRDGLGVRQDRFCSESFRSKNWVKIMNLAAKERKELKRETIQTDFWD